MKMNIVMKSRNNTYYANATYTGGSIIVKAGGRVALSFAEHIQGGKTALKYRKDKKYVDEKGNIIKDCTFSSPSTAAQFVSGNSKNGYSAWRLENGKSLGDYLKEEGLR